MKSDDRESPLSFIAWPTSTSVPYMCAVSTYILSIAGVSVLKDLVEGYFAGQQRRGRVSEISHMHVGAAKRRRHFGISVLGRRPESENGYRVAVVQLERRGHG